MLCHSESDPSLLVAYSRDESFDSIAFGGNARAIIILRSQDETLDPY